MTTEVASAVATTTADDPGHGGVAVNERRVVPPRLSYQPALNGIRALAVIAVMVFHQDHLGGGFLGVDVFFVLSGFLITSLLLIDHGKTGKVISLGFWRRRARRLFPALLVLLALAAVYAATVAAAQDVETIRHGAIATLFYVQNYWVAHHPEDFRYPLAHTWSLSIEEQFYIFWPFVLAILVWWLRLTKWLVVAVIGLALASAGLMAARYTHTNVTATTYLTTETRAHELLIGAALGVMLLGRRVSGRALEIAGIAALGFLVWTAFTAGGYRSFLDRGGSLGIAVVAAVLIAAAVSDGNSHLRTALSWKPLVGIGLISYGLYLYHIPIYGFVNAQHVVTWEPALVVFRFGLTLIFAIASYRWIEQPIRHGALTGKQLMIGAPAAVVVVMAAVLITTTGGEPASPTMLQAVSFSYAKDATSSGTVRVLVAGDSLAGSFAPVGRPEYSGEGIHGVVEWASTCDVIDGQVALGPRILSRAACLPVGPSYRSAVDHYQPAVSVLVLGPSLLFDRDVSHRRLDVGTPEYERYLFDRLDAARRIVTKRGGAFVITTAPCMTPATTGRFAGFALIERDPQRLAAANASLHRYAQDRHVPIADLGGLLCGHRDLVGADGVDLAPERDEAVWAWLAATARTAVLPNQ